MTNLNVETETFETLLPTWVNQEGKFAVITGKELIGIYESYADALTVGYERAGIDKFLVKKISSVECISYISRDIKESCPA